jgi:hypothetical protein
MVLEDMARPVLEKLRSGHATLTEEEKASCRPKPSTRMHDRKVEDLLERVEIAITMQQCVAVAKTERRDQTIDRLPHRMSSRSQEPIVPRRLARQLSRAGFEDMQFQQLPLDVSRRRLVANALKYFADNQVGDAESLAIELGV